MADRFVLVSTRKWRDPWYRTLTLEERQVWNYLTEYPDETQTGIIERLHEDMASECQIEIRGLEGAFARFEQDGKVAFEGKNFLFVRRWLRHQIRRNEIKWEPAKGKKGDNRVLAINLELERLRDKCPNLVAEFEHIYKGLASPYEGATKGLRYINININNNINNNIPESEIPPVVEPKKTKKPKSPSPEKIAKYIPLAEELAEIIAQGQLESGITIPTTNKADASADELRKLITINKIPQKDIASVARWCFIGDSKNNHYYRKNMATISNWRKSWANGIAFVTAFQTWEQAGRPEGGQDHYQGTIADSIKSNIKVGS